MSNRRLVIKWFITTDFLFKFNNKSGVTFDTNKFGNYACIIYTIYSLPSGMSIDELKNIGPEADILLTHVQGNPFHICQTESKVMLGEELEKLDAFFRTDVGKERLQKPTVGMLNTLDITDLLS